MTNRLTKRSKTTYTAAVPEVPARPAYCTTAYGQTVKYVNINTLPNTGVPTIAGYPPIYATHVDPYGNVVVDKIMVAVAQPGDTTVCYPAIPGVPGKEAQQNTDSQIGWNSGARSISTFDGDFEFSFTMPAVPSGAALCGLAPVDAAMGSFTAIEHGIYSSGGVFKIYELGVLIATLETLASNSPALSIRRVGGVVTYLVGSEQHTSGTRSSGAKSGTAALYAAGDYVDTPAVTPLFSGSSHSALTLGGDRAMVRDPLTLGGSASGRDAATGAATVIALDGIQMIFDMSMAAVDHGVYADPGVQGLDLSPAVRMSEDFVSGIKFTFDDPEISATDTTDFLTASIFELIAPISSLSYQPTLFATINESLTVGSTFSVVIGIDARIDEMLILSDPTSVNAIIEAILSSGLTFSDSASQARNEAIQYATNIATGAVTRYSGFGFSSFCRCGQDLYATRPDGLYRIGGETDNGELLSYLIDFAAQDNGSPLNKRLENIFFGISTDGRAFAKLTDDFGKEIVYRLIQRDSTESRIDTAKGVSSRFWHLRLEVEEARYASIDNIEWVAATGTRRTKR